MKRLSVMDLPSFVDEDLLTEMIKEEISSVYLINTDLISNYEKFFENFLPDSIQYTCFVSSDIPITTIKNSLIKAKEPLNVKCFLSSKLPKGRILIILNRPKDNEKIPITQTNPS
ncbi:DUF4898 domain-containing protein [Saccharolobus sp. A20]|uniref:DUF4898 domain-containing protein n=1 Tax=Saccharolobus sp. A20 TaxID=1891280 RepID=UPI001E5007A3|nr:DUF4898 domain-containing protein [Sulfolobus sp. A20]